MSSEAWGRRLLCLPAAFLILGGVSACQKPATGNLGEAVQEKDAPVAVTVVEYTLERVEIEGQNGPLVFPEPVLAIKLKLENKGAGPVPYQPNHTADKATNLQSPLLFVDPGPKNPPSHNITGVYLEEGRLSGQKESKLLQIAPGDSVEDVYLFQPPAEENVELVLTIPPSMHGGKLFMHIKISYTRPNAPAIVTYEPGTDITVGTSTVRVSPGVVQFVALKDSNQGEGFSKDAVFKVPFTIKNGGEGPVQYDPGHTQVGDALGVSLMEVGGAGRFLRVRFGGDREVVGQVRSATTIEPGKSLTDFAIFERPAKQAKTVRVRIPARLFGGEGLIRVDMPYTYADPPKPAP
jgi:hypothetical protein